MTLSNNVLPINRNPCTNGGSQLLGAWTAGSRHADGAHTLFLDGHVAFPSDTLSREVWRVLGSRNGGEIVPE